MAHIRQSKPDTRQSRLDIRQSRPDIRQSRPDSGTHWSTRESSDVKSSSEIEIPLSSECGTYKTVKARFWVIRKSLSHKYEPSSEALHNSAN